MSDDELTEPVDWVGTPADATAIMRAVLQAVTDYRVTHFRGPSELRLADSDWDTIVGNTPYLPAHTAHRPAWPHEQRFRDPQKGPRHGTLFGIPTASDPNIQPGNFQLSGKSASLKVGET